MSQQTMGAAETWALVERAALARAWWMICGDPARSAAYEGQIAGLTFRAAELVYDAEQEGASVERYLRGLYEPTASGR